MKITLLLVCCCLLSSHAQAAEWYSITNGGECLPTAGPADMIKDLRMFGQEYRTEDETVNGKVVRAKVKVYEGEDVLTYTFHRGAKLCREALAKRNRDRAAELNKYR